MKRTKFLALALVVAVALMGAGYAYWTDTLTINNTVSTGELNVRFVDSHGANVTRGGDNQKDRNDAGQGKWYYEAYVKHEGRNGGPATTITNNGKTVNTEVTNMYPGAYAQYYGTIENNGSLPAVFDYATVTFTGKTDANDLDDSLTTEETTFKNNLKFAIGYKIVDADGELVSYSSTTGDNRFWRTGTMDEFKAKIDELFENVKLEPGHKILLDFPSEQDAIDAMDSIDYPYNEDMHCITYTLSPDVVNEDNIENQELGINITLNWKQHNDPNTYED